jgi:hypothetical protein
VIPDLDTFDRRALVEETELLELSDIGFKQNLYLDFKSPEYISPKESCNLF